MSQSSHLTTPLLYMLTYPFFQVTDSPFQKFPLTKKLALGVFIFLLGHGKVLVCVVLMIDVLENKRALFLEIP